MKSDDFAIALNAFGKRKEPFFFAVNYTKDEFILNPLAEIGEDIYYALAEVTNVDSTSLTCKEFSFKKEPIAYSCYLDAFKYVIEQIKSGNTYLLNLTFPTKVTTDMDFLDAFYRSDAPFKLYIKDKFVCFSPERFVKIEENTISTYPMKGTIDAKIPDAKNLILSDEKEKAEHVMAVDLLRNDLSMVASKVSVEKFRYVEKINAGERELLQVSSKIVGVLEENWHEKIGTILSTMLPAGSITGTPKKKSMEIIAQVEGYDRGFFSGVFGVYDGKSLDSAVMIRFLEKTKEGHVFKSGGGITLLSEAQKEYDEMCSKVYVPSF